MTSLAQPPRKVTAGVDTHRDLHVAAVLDSATGKCLAHNEFPTTDSGIRRLETWLRSHGDLDAVGIEGTGTYGAGLTRRLQRAGVALVEVDRPNRRMRRQHGKSDPIDAEAAARAVLSGTATAVPKSRDGLVEAIRPLLAVYSSAVKERTRSINQFKAMIITAPAPLRTHLRPLSRTQQLRQAQAFQIDPDQVDIAGQVRWSLRELALRLAQLDDQMARIDDRLRPLVAAASPALVGMVGVGIHTAARLLVTAGDNPDRLRSEPAFAHLCGVAPIPASSGQTRRNRLNRAGDRRANQALHQIVLARKSHDPRTRAYIQRRLTEGKTERDATRMLKRYLARQVYRALTNPPSDLPPDGPSLRALRHNAGLSMTRVAQSAGLGLTQLSRLERQLDFNTERARHVHRTIQHLDTT